MIEDYKFWLALIAVVLSLYAYIPYLASILKGETKPHLFSWIIWTVLALIAVTILFAAGAGMGAWPSAVAALTACVITILAIKYGTKDIKRSDYVFFFASLSAIPLWIVTKDPTYSAFLVTGITITAAFPTIRKSWHYPAQEVMSTYGINIIRFILSIMALESFSIATTVFPAGMVFMNGMIFGVLLLRRKYK